MKKTIEYYNSLPYKMEIIPDTKEGGFVVSYPELPGCLTCGKTINSAIKNSIEAKTQWLEAALEDKIEIAEPENLDAYSGQFKLRIPKTLHKQLSENSKREGISMNQYCLYLLSTNIEKMGKTKRKAT